MRWIVGLTVTLALAAAMSWFWWDSGQGEPPAPTPTMDDTVAVAPKSAPETVPTSTPNPFGASGDQTPVAEEPAPPATKSLPARRIPGVEQSVTDAIDAHRSGVPATNLLAGQARIDDADRIQVYLHVAQADAAARAELEEMGAEVETVNRQLAMVQARLPVDDVEAFAALPWVRKIALPDYATARAGSVLTEGDGVLGAHLVRALGIDGTGVRVGVISDGANDRAVAQATGDLPDDIVVFGSCQTRESDPFICDPGRTCNEGTAMMEIIHDMAPGAELAMGAVNTSLEFIQRVDELVNVFGADVVVDDLGFLTQSFFEDDTIAQAVAAVTDDVVHVSSAGNAARGHYEADYSEIMQTGGTYHGFSPTDGSMNISLSPGRYMLGILQWNDEFGASDNDYDLQLLDEAEQQPSCIYCNSNEVQDGDDDPVEAVCLFNSGQANISTRLKIPAFDVEPRRLEFLLLGVQHGGVQEYNQPEGSVFGHSGVADVMTVAAVDAADDGNDTVQNYSSRGPVRLEQPELEIRNKPEIAGIDGVSVTGAGGFPSTFYGTSAAAPHVAAITALLQQAAPAATAGDLRDVLVDTAVDIEEPGFDNKSGHGRADAWEAADEIRQRFPEPAPMVSARLRNISTRGQVGSGDSVLIGGLIITGDTPKSVVIRARGQSLVNGDPNLQGLLQDPRLQLFDSERVRIDENDDWGEHPNAGDIPVDLQPTRPEEAAILATLAPGAYTAIVRGSGSQTGLAIVEIIEVSDSGGLRLANISTRGQVASGDAVLIGGVIVNGTDRQRITFRARGPSLADAGVTGVLADPRLRIFDSNGVLIDENDDWQQHGSAAVIDSNLAPSYSSEAAITRYFSPGAYTAIVSGGSGVAIVEAIEVD